jgi:hypothetical protein
MNFSKIVKHLLPIRFFWALGFVFIVMETRSLCVSVPVAGQYYINIPGSIFGVCALSGTSAYCNVGYWC